MTSSTIIPAEILSEIFLFLSRNEVEKCQLVNHQWQHIVSRLSTLPLFEFYCLDIDRRRKRKHKNFLPLEVLLYRYPNSPGIKVLHDPLQTNALQFCYFRKIFNYKNPSKTLVDLFQNINAVTKQPLFAREFIFWGKDYHFLPKLLNFITVTQEVKLQRFEIPANLVENDRISMQICKNGEDPKVWFNFEYALWSLNKQALNYFLLVENELIDVENDEIHVYLPNDSIDIFMQILVEEFRSSSCPDKFIKTLYIFRQEDTSSENICLMFFRRIYVNPEEDNEIVVTRETDSWTLHINVCNEENFILVSKKFNK